VRSCSASVLHCLGWAKRGVSLALLPLLLIMSLITTASFAVMVPSTGQSLEEQIQFIDQEILLLRAELAQSNQDIPALRRYIRQLQSTSLAPIFKTRLVALQSFLLLAGEANPAEHAFKLPQEGGQIIVLLPLSGDYAVAGHAILEGLKSAWPFNKRFTVIDSAIYSTMVELWELVKLYEPGFVIGPLSKQNILSWQNLETQIPTLYLNQPNYLFEYEKALSPNKKRGLLQLKAFIEATGLENVVVLQRQHQAAKKLQKQFKQAWLTQKTGRFYESLTIQGGIHQTMKTVLNVQKSIARKNWVQKTIQQELEFEARARKDLDAVVHFSSLDEAIQVKPILDFYHLSDAYSVWYPSILPSSDELQSQQNIWQQTYALLPPYLTQVQKTSSDEDSNEVESGLFYALGRLVAEVVKNPRLNLPTQSLIRSELGEVITDENGVLSILPNVFWLDEKFIQPVNEYRYPFE